jgi:hypothetical protein
MLIFYFKIQYCSIQNIKYLLFMKIYFNKPGVMEWNELTRNILLSRGLGNIYLKELPGGIFDNLINLKEL